MQKIAIILGVTLLLSSCVHKMNVQQGNIIEQDNVKKLYVGMSEDEVKDIMGTPVLINTFKDNRVDYVYTNKPGYGAGTEKTLTLIFQNNRLKNMSAVTEQPFEK
jgi:outer membrane protein assembly factor BamE